MHCSSISYVELTLDAYSRAMTLATGAGIDRCLLRTRHPISIFSGLAKLRDCLRAESAGYCFTIAQESSSTTRCRN